MKAGLLKETIIILRPSNVTSEYGENNKTYIAVYKTRANAKYKSQNRSNENNEIFFDTTVEFKIRHYVSIEEFDRIEWKNKQYRILSLLPDTDNQQITIITELIND